MRQEEKGVRSWLSRKEGDKPIGTLTSTIGSVPEPQERTLRDTARHVQRYVELLEEGDQDEAWAETGGALLGKSWKFWRAEMEKEMSIAHYKFDTPGSMGNVWLSCLRCKKDGEPVPIARVNGRQLHEVVSIAHAHDAREHTAPIGGGK